MSEPLLRDTERAKLAEAMELLVTIARDIVRFIVRLLPALIRVACVSVCAYGVIYGTIEAWGAWGGDGAALIPAVLLGVVPLAYAFINRVMWGGMVAAGVFTYAVAKGMGYLPFHMAQLLIIITLATLAFMQMSKRGQPAMELTQNESIN